MTYFDQLRGRWDVPCPEIDAICEELVLRGVPVRVERFRDYACRDEDHAYGWHLVYQGEQGRVSVIWSASSWGQMLGLLEAWDYDERSDPQGYLTAANVLRRFPPAEVAR